VRAISRDKLADRKKIRSVLNIAIQQGWLNLERELPTDDELLKFFKPRQCVISQSLALPYREQIERWVGQGIQPALFTQRFNASMVLQEVITLYDASCKL
jgi:hypothetical protein